MASLSSGSKLQSTIGRWCNHRYKSIQLLVSQNKSCKVFFLFPWTYLLKTCQTLPFSLLLHRFFVIKHLRRESPLKKEKQKVFKVTTKTSLYRGSGSRGRRDLLQLVSEKKKNNNWVTLIVFKIGCIT